MRRRLVLRARGPLARDLLPGIAAPIASAATVQQVEEPMGSLEVTLDVGDLQKRDRASAP